MHRALAIALLLIPAMGRAQSAPAPAKPAVQQTVTVTADRGLANITDSATSVASLSSLQLQQTPGLTLDDRLHSVAGFTLFRRTSSWTANPTTEGVSLRGLGSTAASRTLVVSDELPLNDPFGGWIHWDEIPALAIDHVNLLRGGSADLYGSSAIGGVIDVVLTPPLAPRIALFSTPSFGTNAVSYTPNFTFLADASGATENSTLQDALLTTSSRHLSLLAADSFLTTGGYIPTAPSLRGSVDIPSNVTAESARLELNTHSLHTPFFDHTTAFLRGNILNESRSNGTPLQTNATRLWRYAAGADSSNASTSLTLRAYGSRESYRQSFSSITATRSSETLTNLQRVPTDQFGFVLHAAHSLLPQLTAALGVDLNDVRATDDETKPSTSVTTSISARQRETGGYADAIWQPGAWSLSASIRVDSFRTFNAQQVTSNAALHTALPETNELVASPRVGLVRTLPHGFAVTANAFRAFRGPTMNELYRTGQVGQQTTLANPSLLAERATGFEFGGELSTRALHLRSTYFWTEVSRPISAVLLLQTPTTQTLQRQNLGQIRSRGLMLEAQTSTWKHLDANFGYQLAVATVTAFNSSSAAQINLTGNWIPEVPRQSFTSTVNYTAPRIADFHLIASYTGQAYDDAANTFLLHPYARFDVTANRNLPHGLSLFASAQNLLDRQIDAGRTPILTLAAPRLVQAGLRYTFLPR